MQELFVNLYQIWARIMMVSYVLMLEWIIDPSKYMYSLIQFQQGMFKMTNNQIVMILEVISLVCGMLFRLSFLGPGLDLPLGKDVFFNFLKYKFPCHSFTSTYSQVLKVTICCKVTLRLCRTWIMILHYLILHSMTTGKIFTYGTLNALWMPLHTLFVILLNHLLELWHMKLKLFQRCSPMMRRSHQDQTLIFNPLNLCW